MNKQLFRLTQIAVITLGLAASSNSFAEQPRPPKLSGEAQTYTVVSGDGLYSLARKLGLAYPAVARANGIENPNQLIAGSVLTLPTQFILPEDRAEGVVVNIPECRLYLYHEGAVIATYPVAVGLPTWKSPIGDFSVTSKVENPAWYMPPDIAARENVKREIIEAGPDNPLGDYWIGTSLKHTGIHGTNRPMSIGRPLSHGCMRMYPEHIEALFKAVSIGDSGSFVYEPIKIVSDSAYVMIEVYPDIYDKFSNLTTTAEKQLRDMGLWDRVDARLMQKAVEEERGIPVTIQKK